MPGSDLDRLHLPSRTVRLDTLVRLRWLSIIGQTFAVLVAYYIFELDLPVWGCLAVISLAAWLNVALHLRFRRAQRLEPTRAALLLGFDIAQLAVMVYFTGGLENPFAFLFLGPVVIAATSLPPRMTIVLGSFAILCTTILIDFHYPLPWWPDDRLTFSEAYNLVTWLSMVLAILFISIYAWQVSEESRQLVNALAATELALAREQHLSQLDGLAAAAAHALGTPLSTISVVVRELERAFDENSPHAEDLKLLREQAQRCRDILAGLSQMPPEDEPFNRPLLSVLLEEVAAPHRDFGIEIAVNVPQRGQPLASRNPAIVYGLGNILENAVDFARERVEVSAQWTDEIVSVTISDDGPGFAPEIISRIGEPYVRSSRRRRMQASDEAGLGLGFFIAKTLLERSGATLSFVNRAYPQVGAVVTVRWPHAAFDWRTRPDLEKSPAGA